MEHTRMKSVDLSKAVMEAGNPLAEVYMTVRVYSDTTIEELSTAEGFYMPDNEPAPEPEPKKRKEEKRGGVMKPADHGAIVALYTANPPRSIKWIAEDQRISPQTVIKHLKKEGIFDPGRKET